MESTSMTSLIHVLGSDIPHHNFTILRFFNDQLASTNINARIFMIVGYSQDFETTCPALTLFFFSDKEMLAKAVVNKAKYNRKQRFFFHGQFNARLWLALLNGKIQSKQFNWHIWGADLYEISRSWKYRLFYTLRRLAQKRVGYVFATQGDLVFLSKVHPTVRKELLYFPTRMDFAFNALQDSNHYQHGSKLTILVGNSGDHSNQHISALNSIYRQFGDTVNLIIPMGYPLNNEAYITKVHRYGLMLFNSKNLHILNKKISFNNYLSILRRCDLGYFIFARQQGIGTLCLLTQAGIPCVLNRKNLFWKDMAAQNIPVLFNTDKLSKTVIREAQRQLTLINKNNIDFFFPNYLDSWHRAIWLSSGERI